MAKIVIVDDALFMRKLLSMILSKEGHQIVGEGGNAKDAIALYEQFKPDLLTLDIIMPEVDGISTYAAIKKIKEIDNSAKIIMVSAMGQQDIIEESFKAGASDFIIKPFEEQNVINSINKIL